MISRRQSWEADTDTLSDLRSGSRLIGVRLLRDVVRAGDPMQLLGQGKSALAELIEEISATARDDSAAGTSREKAAEFLIQLRSRQNGIHSLSALVDKVACAAAIARYRSGRVLDFLAVWLFIAGEQFIAQVDEPKTVVDLEAAHPEIWQRFRSNILETLEAGHERLKDGRRFRLAETYLARFRLVRAKNERRFRDLAGFVAAANGAWEKHDGPDYVASMVLDLFVLSLSEKQQTLIVSRLQAAAPARARSSVEKADYQRLFAPLRAVRPDQGFERFEKVIASLQLPRQRAVADFVGGLLAHLKRTWDWFFPDRRPFGVLRRSLQQLEASAREHPSAEALEEFVDRAFGRYAESLAYVVRLATEDSENREIGPQLDDGAEGVL